MQATGLQVANENQEGRAKGLATSVQSTSHLLLIEPAEFYANPQTMETNVYQVDEHENPDDIYQKAITEFRGFRDMLVENGVAVTTLRGVKGCPDHIFPNWISTHTGRQMIIYPMLNDNRRAERTPEMIAFFESLYDTAFDFRAAEQNGQFLESTGSLCLDRVNRIAYVALSGRTDEALAREWGAQTGYEVVIFETTSHTGKPVYHTDLVMWIGTECAALCSSCIRADQREAVLAKLRETHDVIELDMDQLAAFCGNALEIMSTDGERMLVMSEAAYQGLGDTYKKTFGKYFARLLHAPIPTIETYGGGSARCLIMELF